MRHSEGVRFMSSYSTGGDTWRTSFTHCTTKMWRTDIQAKWNVYVKIWIREQVKDTNQCRTATLGCSLEFSSCCYHQVKLKSYGEWLVGAVPNVCMCPSYRVSPCVDELFGLLTCDLAELYDCLSLLVAGVGRVCKVFGFLHQSFQLSRHSLTGHTVQRVSQTLHFNLKNEYKYLVRYWFMIYNLLANDCIFILYWICNCFIHNIKIIITISQNFFCFCKIL